MLRQHLVAVLDHGAKFQAAENVAVPADARMAVEHAAAAGKLHQHRQHEKQRAEQDDAGDRAGDIESAFEGAAHRRLGVAVRS